MRCEGPWKTRGQKNHHIKDTVRFIPPHDFAPSLMRAEGISNLGIFEAFHQFGASNFKLTFSPVLNFFTNPSTFKRWMAHSLWSILLWVISLIFR
jgi:hypothetical protein